MEIVACLLAPWSSGKDPDRNIYAPEKFKGATLNICKKKQKKAPIS
jgi:hypothetical protein